jgi:GNAT superfamily N-acetyltransferase
MAPNFHSKAIQLRAHSTKSGRAPYGGGIRICAQEHKPRKRFETPEISALQDCLHPSMSTPFLIGEVENEVTSFIYEGNHMLPRSLELSATPIVYDDIPFWMEIYEDDIVKRQMYAPPLDTPVSLWAYLTARQTFTVWLEPERVGGFMIAQQDHIGTFGLALHRTYRGRGYGGPLMGLIEQTARALGIRTLRADVYEDNDACLKLLNQANFRTFVWLEKNIS